MRFCPSFHATLRQSYCRSFLLVCLSLTLVENICADERIRSLSSLSARNQLDHGKSAIAERTLSDRSLAPPSALAPRYPRLALIKRHTSSGIDTSDLPVNLTLTKSSPTSAPETHNTSQTDSHHDSYTDPSPNSNHTSVVTQQKPPELDDSKAKESDSKLNASLTSSVKNHNSSSVSSESTINQATTIAVPSSTKGDIRNSTNANPDDKPSSETSTKQPKPTNILPPNPAFNSTNANPDDKLSSETSTKQQKPANISPLNSAVTNQSSAQDVEAADHKLSNDTSSQLDANLTSSDSGKPSSGLSSNYSGQPTVTRVIVSANKTGDSHHDDTAYSSGKTHNRTTLVNSDLPPLSDDSLTSNHTGGSTGAPDTKDSSNLTDGGLAGSTANNASDIQSTTLSTGGIPLHNDTSFVTSSLSGNHTGDVKSDKSSDSPDAPSNISVLNNTILRNNTSDATGTPAELSNSSASAALPAANFSQVSLGQGPDSNKQTFDNTTAFGANNQTTSTNLAGHGTSDVKHNVSSIDDGDASSDAFSRNGTGVVQSPIDSTDVKNVTSDDKGPKSVLPDMYLNRTGLSNNFRIPAGFNGTGIPLSAFKSHNDSSETKGSIDSAFSHLNSSSDPYFDGDKTDVVQNSTIFTGINGTGIPMSAFKSHNDSSDIKGSIDSAFSHLNSSSDPYFDRDETQAPNGENFTNVSFFNVSGTDTTNLSDQAAAALWRLNKTRAGLSDSSKDLNSTLLPSDLDGTTATAGSGFSIAPTGSSVGDSTLANSTSDTPLYKNTTVIPSTGESINASLLHTGVLPINASLLNNSEAALLPNVAANYTDGSLGKLAWNASLNSTQNNTLNSSLAAVIPHNSTAEEPTTVPLNHTLPVAAPAFVPVSSLFTNPTTPAVEPNVTTQNTPAPKPKPAEHETQASFPTTWPRYIVPSNTPTSPPENSTLISILFSNALSWPWLVTNSNASSQVLVFMPALISTALNIDPSEVVTQSLQAYQPADFAPDDEGAMLTIWLGFIPNQYVNTLQAMLKDPQSAFYNQSNPIYAALSKTVDPSLPITTFSSQARAAQRNAATSTASDSPPSANQGQKAAVIASVTSCGAAILAIGLFLAARQSKQKLRPGRIPFSGDASSGARSGSNLRALHLSSSGRLQISSPMIGTLSHNAGHTSHYYGQGAQRPHSFSGHSVFPIGQYSGAQPGTSEANVHYEYGHARTTSSDNQYSPPPADTRSSWWRFNQEDLEEPELPENRFDSSRLAEPYQGNNLRRSDGSFAVDASQRPGHRRLQITRGADGLVSGIGRPVMKENSLFF